MRRFCLLLALLAACGDKRPSPPRPPPAPEEKPPPASRLPERVTWEQILIVFKGSYVRKGPDGRPKVKVESNRTPEEARALATSIFERAQAGVDFEALKQEYSDERDPSTDSALGPFRSRMDGARLEMLDEQPLSHLSKAVAEVVYRLEVGEIGFVEHDELRSADGWLIIKRVK